MQENFEVEVEMMGSMRPSMCEEWSRKARKNCILGSIANVGGVATS